jgi:peptidoglycan/xylan/chitin deacetylase (PgdA/CDA1 family)
VTILAYHLVGAGTGSPVDLPEEVFLQQMEELRRSGRAIPLSAALRLLEGAETLAEDRVAITFDDAFDNFDRVARPVLEELELPATLFVPTDFLDGTAPGPLAGAEGLAPVAWSRLRELVRGGLVEVGSHSRSHPDLRALGDAQLDGEVRGSAETIRERLGVAPEVFCYPRGLTSARVEARVAAADRGAVAGGGVKNRPGRTRRECLRRVSLRADMPRSLGPVLGSAVVLEEWLANRARLLRPDRRSGARPR